MRPSEAIALRWGDIDVKTGSLSITKARYFGADNPTKTVASGREIAVLGGVTEVRRAMKSLKVTEADFVFKKQEGRPNGEQNTGIALYGIAG
jgi:integrase